MELVEQCREVVIGSGEAPLDTEYTSPWCKLTQFGALSKNLVQVQILLGRLGVRHRA
jgi:hypothetical protein